MNCYKAPDDHLPKEKVTHSPKVNGDELCDESACNDQRRVHIFDRACGRFPCQCTTFVPSGRFYDWKNQLVPDVRLGERAKKNLKEIRDGFTDNQTT